MQGKKIKDSSSSARFAASNDGIRLFNKALELLSSTTPDSEHELLDLVKKAKRERDADQESADTSKKTPGRGYDEFSDLSAYSQRTILVPMPGHVGVQPVNSNVESGAPNSCNSALVSTSATLGHTHSRLIHAARSGSSKSCAEKPKRKLAR